MCGICGMICRGEGGGGTGDGAVVERMNAAMVHRGPDDSGMWLGEGVALAMRRLSILDLEGGHQPMANEDGSVVAVFNGEIYNFEALRNSLAGCGHVFKTHSDTEVIVHGYEEYGDGVLDRLNGMFAIALYDARKGRLLLARDRLGIKPLFYAERPEGLVFASELGALMESGIPDDELNPAALDAYLTYLYVPEPDTIYRDVVKLRPGEKLVWAGGALEVERYWRPRFAVDGKWTLDSAAEAFRALLEDSVRLRRISDVPLGAFLSGGVDSSCVVAALSAMSTAPVKTFTIGFDDAHADELEYARIAAQHFGTEHTETILRPDMAAMAPELAAHFGEPFADSSAVPTWLVSKVAREQVTVALSGDGGDESFAGYTWTHMNHRVARYRRVPPVLRSLVAAALHMFPQRPGAAKLRRFARDAGLSHRESFRRRQTCFAAEARAAMYRPEFATQIADTAHDRFAELAEAGPADPDDWMLYQDTMMYLPGDILTKVDRMSMANSLEARVPLLDHRMVEFAATVPFSLKFDGRTSKRLVKHAMGDALPPQLLAQRKRGFAIPIHRWFREDLRALFEDAVLAPSARCHAYLDPEPMRELFADHVAGRENYGHHLWALLVLEIWLEGRR